MSTRQYRVVTTDHNGGVSILCDWQSRAACRRYIIGRWGHWPPFAHISSASGDNLDRLYGLDR